jgi:predicted ribosomally synthesized peptide with SipW-like signal peptide
VRAVLALGSVAGIGLLGTSAAFSDEATVTATFTAGTLDVTVDGEEGRPTPYAVSFTGADSMAPGDTVYAPLEVANVGTVDAELSMSVDVTPDGTTPNATDDLEMVVAHTTGTACDATVVADDATPHSPAGPLAAAAMADVALPGGDAVELCLAVTLPGSVTGTGGGAADVDLEFLAEQAG